MLARQPRLRPLCSPCSRASRVRGLCVRFAHAPAALAASAFAPLTRQPRFWPLRSLRSRASRSRSLCARIRSRFSRSFPPPPRGAVLTGCPSGHPVARVLLCSLSFSASPDSLQQTVDHLLLQRALCLRPAGQRPASRRLSRSPSAPERTITVLLRRRRGRTCVLSGAEGKAQPQTAGLPSAASPLASLTRAIGAPVGRPKIPAIFVALL